jgi:hypothetical protein
MFRQNNTLNRERLCSFLSHFSFNMVGDKLWYVGSTVRSMTCLLPNWRWSGSERNIVLPDDGVALPKHVATIVRKIKNYIFQCILLVNLYIFDNARYKNKKNQGRLWYNLIGASLSHKRTQYTSVGSRSHSTPLCSCILTSSILRS